MEISVDRITQEPPMPEVQPDVLVAIDPSTLEDSHVYVHCHYAVAYDGALARIWKTTFLTDAASGARSSLLHAENIALAPQWTTIPRGVPFTFLLIFTALPKSCLRFDLIEEISLPGRFEVRDIQRNETDVYHVNLG